MLTEVPSPSRRGGGGGGEGGGEGGCETAPLIKEMLSLPA